MLIKRPCLLFQGLKNKRRCDAGYIPVCGTLLKPVPLTRLALSAWRDGPEHSPGGA